MIYGFAPHHYDRTPDTSTLAKVAEANGTDVEDVVVKTERSTIYKLYRTASLRRCRLSNKVDDFLIV